MPPCASIATGSASRPNFWGGYAGYFQDPDAHLWEVVWNPAWEGAAAGV
jgi:uncharacterized protein